MVAGARLIRPAVLASLVLLTALWYTPTLRGPWVYEDVHWLSAVETAPPRWQIPGRALTMQTYAWTWSVVGREPFVYRLTNLGLHLTNGSLVYAVGAALAPAPVALAAAAIFLGHGLNSEAVSYVTARADLLVTAFVLGAIAIVLRWRAWWAWALVGCALLGAGLSKETGLMGVPIVVLTILLFRREVSRGLALAPLWIGLGAACGAMWPAFWTWLASSDPSVTLLGWPDFLRYQLTAVWYLASRAIWPSGFSIDHDIVGLSAWWHLGAMAATGAVAASLPRLWRTRPLVAWATIWIAIAVLPRFVFRTSEWVHEYQFYLAMPAVSLLLARAGAALWMWPPAWWVREREFWRAVGHEGALT